jgi:hypothetical protein
MNLSEGVLYLSADAEPVALLLHRMGCSQVCGLSPSYYAHTKRASCNCRLGCFVEAAVTLLCEGALAWIRLVVSA